MLLRTRAAVLLAAVALAACGSGDEGAATAPVDDVASPTPTVPEAALASLALVDPAAEFRSDQVADFEAATDGQPLAEGDEVRTDLTGFALVEYLDGSVTRLDTATRFVVQRLDGTADAPIVHTRLDIGRAWNNVSDAVADGEFSVETAVATATVRGTIFLVECPVRLICTFAVVEGTVDVEANDGTVVVLEAGQQVSVGAEGVRGDVVDNDRGAPGTDAWVDRNHAIDGGEPDPGGAADLGDRPMFRALEPIGDVMAPGDTVLLTWVRGALNVADPGECDGRFHLHDATGDGIFVLAFGPFADPGGDCGYGLTLNWEEPGPVGGGQILVVPSGG